MTDEEPDFRADRMETPEGRGIARKAWEAWDAYARTVNRAGAPITDPLIKGVATGTVVDLMGFWLVWHLDGGFEGLLEMGWNRSTIYRKINAFRKVTGQHPDEFVMPGVHLELNKYQEAGSLAWKMRGPEPSEVRAQIEARKRR